MFRLEKLLKIRAILCKPAETDRISIYTAGTPFIYSVRDDDNYLTFSPLFILLASAGYVICVCVFIGWRSL